MSKIKHFTTSVWHCRYQPSMNHHLPNVHVERWTHCLFGISIPYLVLVHEYSIWSTATAGEAGPGKPGGTDHEYRCIHEPVGPHTVVSAQTKTYTSVVLARQLCKWLTELPINCRKWQYGHDMNYLYNRKNIYFFFEGATPKR